MDSSGASSSPSDSFKSKKVLRSSVGNPQLSGKVLETTDQNPWTSKTPKKPAPPPPSLLTRRQSLRSVNQVREAAKQLAKSDLKPTVSSVPVKSSPTEIPVSKPNASKSLPEKYELLYRFFHSLGSSLRLLRLKRTMSTFTNIKRHVESLTDRSFSYKHLAQMKYILPDAIEIKKIVVLDDLTSCMKPDLHISLNFSTVKNDENLSLDTASLKMSKLFRSRLASFCEANSEGDDVPEEMLPEPFNQSNRSPCPYPFQKQKVESVQESTIEQQPIAASHLRTSFKRRFSNQEVPIPNVETVKQSRVSTSEDQVHISSTKLASVSDVKSPAKWSEKLPETPIKCFDGTPVKLSSTPFTATPAQSIRPPARCLMTPDEQPIMSPSKLARRATRTRSITFDTPVKNKTPRSNNSRDDDLSDILSHDLLASIKQKELKALEENNPEISQAKWRKKMVARLPKLFDMLLFFFQSTKRTVITKQELVKTIITNQLEIADPKEVEEQLRLLKELASEWIYEKVASSGDLLICVNKISSPECIRARLSKAS